MDTFNRRMDLQHEEMMRHNEAIVRQNEAIERQHEAYARQEERQQQQFQAIEQLRLWMEHRFPPPSQGNISTSPLSSVFGSPPPSPKGIPRTEMMVPRHTLERGETSRGNHDDSSSEEGEGYNMEYANRGLMLQVEDLFRFRHFRAKEIIEWCYVDTPTLEALGIRREYERIATQPFWRAICSWRDATYTPIVREFVATLEVNEEIRDRRLPSIKFKLFNKEYDISSDALGNLLGFYTLADQGQAWYANLVEDFENELQEDLFWWSITRPGVTWRASYTSARYIKVPELLILWHIVARSWLGRRTRNDNITRSELFILWSMYTETPVHMGELCKRILKMQSYEDSENIFIGPLVSRLAEALGFEEVLSQEVVTTTMRPIDMEECVHLGLRFNDTMEETRESELWDTIRRLEHWVDVLELEVRRLILDSHGEEPFELREWSSAPR
nr:putative retrotransposon Orf1 [Ipomoea batatas]